MSVEVEAEAEAEVLEEDVFPEEAVSCFLSPLNTESLDFPDTPVSSHLGPQHIALDIVPSLSFCSSPCDSLLLS